MSTGAKRSAPPGRWTLEVAPVDVDGKRSPSPGDPWKAGLGYDFKSNSVTGSVGNDHLKGSAYYDLYDSRYGGSLTYKNGAHSFGISGSGGRGGSNYGAFYKFSWKRSASPAIPLS